MRSKLENTFLSKEKIRLASSDCLRWKRDIRKLTCVLIFLGRGNTRRRKTGIAVQMSKTLLYLRDHKIESIEQLDLLVQQQTARRDTLLFSIQQSEKRLAEIGILKKTHHQLFQNPGHLRRIPESRVQQKVPGGPSGRD